MRPPAESAVRCTGRRFDPQEGGEDANHHEINDGADGEEGDIQIRGLVTIAARLPAQAIRPAVDVMHAEQHREEEHGHKGQRAISGRGQAADGAPPHAAAQELHHHHDQRAEGYAAPDQPGEEVGAEELPVIEKRADDRDHASDTAGDQRLLLPAGELRLERGAVHGSASCAWPAASASAGDACWLSWSARR